MKILMSRHVSETQTFKKQLFRIKSYDFKKEYKLGVDSVLIWLSKAFHRNNNLSLLSKLNHF